jgi:hypothetical protein
MTAQVITAIVQHVNIVNILWPIVAIIVLVSGLWIEYRCYQLLHGGGFLPH